MPLAPGRMAGTASAPCIESHRYRHAGEYAPRPRIVPCLFRDSARLDAFAPGRGTGTPRDDGHAGNADQAWRSTQRPRKRRRSPERTETRAGEVAISLWTP